MMMEPGREIDSRIAEKVMGYECVCDEIPWGLDCPIHAYDDRDTLRPYSTDIAAAWAVVEELAKNGWRLSLETKLLYKREIRAYTVSFDRLVDDDVETVSVLEVKTAPLAICLAALKAAGVEVGDD